MKKRPAKEPEHTEEPVPVVLSASFINTAALRNKKMNRFFTILLTFFLINITWVFFRAQDFDTAWRLLSSMFTSTTGGTMVLSTLGMIKVSVVITLMIASHWMLRNRSIVSVGSKAPWWLTGTAWAAMIILLMLSQQSSSSFIYFQF